LLEAARALIEAERRGDLEALERLVARDYGGFDPGGRPQDRATLLAGHAEAHVRVEAVEPAELVARVLGEVGVVSGRTRIAGRALGERFELRLRFLDVFAWRAGRWELFASSATPIPLPLPEPPA
jgi:hypothetical protein